MLDILISIVTSGAFIYFCIGYSLIWGANKTYENIKLRRWRQYHMKRATQRKNTRNDSIRNFFNDNAFPDEEKRKHILTAYKGILIFLIV